MRNSFGVQLQKRDLLIGTIITLSDPQVAEIFSSKGFEWLFIDGEHAPLGAMEIQRILQAVQGRCPCAVRIPANQEAYIKQALDNGAGLPLEARIASGVGVGFGFALAKASGGPSACEVSRLSELPSWLNLISWA